MQTNSHYRASILGIFRRLHFPPKQRANAAAHKTPNIEHKTPRAKRQMPRIKCRTPRVKCRTPRAARRYPSPTAKRFETPLHIKHRTPIFPAKISKRRRAPCRPIPAPTRQCNRKRDAARRRKCARKQRYKICLIDNKTRVSYNS